MYLFTVMLFLAANILHGNIFCRTMCFMEMYKVCICCI